MPTKVCPLNKCDGSGLIPFKNKEGKLIPFTWEYCACHEEGPSHHHALKPTDFDFPVSYDYYRMLCQENGWTDPGNDRPSESPEHKQERVVVHRHSDMSQKDFVELQEVKGRVKYLQSKVDKLTRRRKPVKKETNYKGLNVES